MLDKIRPTALLFGLGITVLAFVVATDDVQKLPPEFVGGIIGSAITALGLAMMELVKSHHHHE